MVFYCITEEQLGFLDWFWEDVKEFGFFDLSSFYNRNRENVGRKAIYASNKHCKRGGRLLDICCLSVHFTRI